MRKKLDGMREKLKSAENSEDWNSVLRIEEKPSLPPDGERKEYFMKLDQDLQKVRDACFSVYLVGDIDCKWIKMLMILMWVIKTINARKLVPERVWWRCCNCC